MPSANEARELAEECERLVVTATNAENRALLLKIAHLWRDVASREDAVESGQAIALEGHAQTPDDTIPQGVVLANTQAETQLLRTRARHWRRKAMDLRRMAEEGRSSIARATFARLANNYDGLADQAELTAINLTEAETV